MDTKRPVGYIDNYQPYKKTQITICRVREILDEYREHLPLTVRQIYYRMVAPHGYPKGKAFETHLSEALGQRSPSPDHPIRAHA